MGSSVRLSGYAFIIMRMKYDSAIFSLPLSLMDVILNTIACRADVRTKSHLPKAAISPGKPGSLDYILNVCLKIL